MVPDFLLKAKHRAGCGRQRTFNKDLVPYLFPFPVPASLRQPLSFWSLSKREPEFSIFSRNGPSLVTTYILACGLVFQNIGFLWMRISENGPHVFLVWGRVVAWLGKGIWGSNCSLEKLSTNSLFTTPTQHS